MLIYDNLLTYNKLNKKRISKNNETHLHTKRLKLRDTGFFLCCFYGSRALLL